ncbi:MAG: dihydroorotase [Paludibacteraceae bacterium]|nr:dihydroorotase [Paludibacteraceae bacterium]
MLIYNARIINEGRSFVGYLTTRGNKITRVCEGVPAECVWEQETERIDAEFAWLMPGAIDAHVHFREPGLTHKADILHESKAALAGGVTSFMEMPNTQPQTTTVEAWENKYHLAQQSAYANYAFYIGATNDNADQWQKLDPKRLCGIKLFLGSSTGNMLVNEQKALQQIFAEAETLVAAHCEDEQIIRANMEYYRAKGMSVPIAAHPLIRSREACVRSTEKAMTWAEKYAAKLHVLHISTTDELSLLSEGSYLNKRITAETCPHYLFFSDKDYASMGARIKCNPAIKTVMDREALRMAICTGKVDTIGSDHAPHLLADKQGDCTQAVSGFPSIQHNLPLLFDLAEQGCFSKVDVVRTMAHAPADIYSVEKRGYLREGYYADFVLIKEGPAYEIHADQLLYKCKWSPLEGRTLKHRVKMTVLNGVIAYADDHFAEHSAAMPLSFTRN